MDCDLNELEAAERIEAMMRDEIESVEIAGDRPQSWPVPVQILSREPAQLKILPNDPEVSEFVERLKEDALGGPIQVPPGSEE